MYISIRCILYGYRKFWCLNYSTKTLSITSWMRTVAIFIKKMARFATVNS